MALRFGISDALFAPYRRLWLCADFVLAAFAYMLAVWLSPYTQQYGVLPRELFYCSAIFSIAFCVLGVGAGFYERRSRFRVSSVLGLGLLLAAGASMISLAIIYFAFYEKVGRLTLLYGDIAAFSAIAVVRLFFAWHLKRHPYRFTILGSSPCCTEIQEYYRGRSRSERGYDFVPWRELETTHQLSTVKLTKFRVADIVLTKSAFKEPHMIDSAVQALQVGCRLVDEVDFYSGLFERLPIDDISISWLVKEGLATRRFFTSVLKRILDVTLAALALVLLSPLMIIIAVLIKVTSPGPILYIQRRLGHFCQPFSMYKFRTMTNACDNETRGFTQANDARVTKIGRFLRPLHLDELPQLWNILLGTMSIVGARPEELSFARRMRAELPLYELRYLLRPGLTGLAQINQGYAMDSVDETKAKLAYDLYYLCNYNIWLDIRVMLRTVFCLARGAR